MSNDRRPNDFISKILLCLEIVIHLVVITIYIAVLIFLIQLINQL